MEEEIFSFSELNDRLSVQSARIDFSHKRSFSYFLSKQHIFLGTIKILRIAFWIITVSTKACGTAVWRRIIRFKLFNGKLHLTLFWYKGRLWSKNFKSKPYPIFEFWFRAIKTDFLPLLCVRARNIHCVHASVAPQWKLKSKNSNCKPHPKFKFWSNIIWLASKGVLILTHWSATRWNHEISPNYKNFSKVHHIHASKQFPRTVRPKQSHYELRLKLPTNHATLRLGIVALITRTSWDRGYALSQG